MRWWWVEGGDWSRKLLAERTDDGHWCRASSSGIVANITANLLSPPGIIAYMASQVVDKILGAAIVNKGFRGQSTGLSAKVRLLDLEHVITPQHASVYQLPFISQQQPNQVLPFRSGYKAPIQSRLGR